MKNIILITILNLILITLVPAQVFFSRYFDFAGDNDNAWKIIKGNNRYFMLSANLCHQNTVSCTGIICFDNALNLTWKIEIDSVGPNFYDCLVTDESNLYLVVTPEHNPNQIVRFYKFDLNGNLVTQKEFGPFLKSITPIALNYSNSKLFLTASFFHDFRVSGYDSNQVWQLNTDFELIYTFTDTDKRTSENLIGFESTGDGNYIGIKALITKNNGTECLVKKFDSTGKIIWSRLLPWESGYRVQYSNQKIRPTHDNGCIGIWNQTIEILSNDTFPDQPILFKLDANGNLKWSRTFFSKQAKRLVSLFEAANGDIIGIGEDENLGNNSRYKLNGWIVRLSKDGDIIWERTYNDTLTLNGYSHFYDGIEENNGNLILCGSIRPIRDPGIIINTDNWLVHTDRNGCILPSCDSFQLLTKIDFPKELPFAEVRFTNPVENELVVESDSFSSPVSITITDLKSSKILEFKEMLLPLKCNVSQVPAGIYLLKIQDMRTHISKTYKFLKI